MEDPDDVALGSGYPAVAAQAAGARDMLRAAADLANPVAAARELPWLAGELIKIALGRSDLAYAEKDPRFQDVTWRDNPVFRRLGQSYRLYEDWTDRMVEAAEGPWERQARAR
jgi:polyhydroxyalkanoate synthase